MWGKAIWRWLNAQTGQNLSWIAILPTTIKKKVLGYLASKIGLGTHLQAFICTHRDADHMRGVKILHDNFPLQGIWDSGVPGTSTDTQEYQAYMRLRRTVGEMVIEKKTYKDYGRTRFRYFSAKDARLPSNANEQGIVLKVEQRTSDMNTVQGSTILTGDCGVPTWRDGILKDYSAAEISCDILLAAHHGSITFFDNPGNNQYYYTEQIRAIKPDMVVVSVGNNSYGHPDSKALELYKKYSNGSNTGNKIRRTDRDGTMKLVLKSLGGWNLTVNQN